MKTTIVTGADQNYLPLMIELIQSIRRHEQGRTVDICIMDTGLTAGQVDRLKESDEYLNVVKPDWPVGLPTKKIKGRDFLKSCICRPHIPDIFPGYDQYLWLDADTWVQDWRAIDLLWRGAETGAMSCTMLVDRAFPKSARLQFFGPLPIKAKSFYYSNAKRSLGYKTARKLYGYNVVSAGAFSLRADAPHWRTWQDIMHRILRKGKIFTAEQLALGVMAHIEKLPMEYLPSWCHWPFLDQMIWNKDEKKFTEPYLPHEPIGIIHLSGVDDMRVDRSVQTDVLCADGTSQLMSLRYPYFNGETGEAVHS